MERRTRFGLRFWALSLALVGCAGATSLGQSAQTYTGAVSGHVYCADTNTPCRFASVNLQSAPPERTGMAPSEVSPSHSYGAQADLNGSYRIEGVAPGQYFIVARYPGYVSGYDLAEVHSIGEPTLSSPALRKYLTRITVTANQTTTADITLERGATIEGTVRYDDGAPGIGIPIRLFRKDDSGKWVFYNHGSDGSPFSMIALALGTDARGHYYKAGLPPGSYIVEVKLPEVSLVPTTIVGNQPLKMTDKGGDALCVFSGDKYRLEDATPVDVTAGEDLSGVDIDIPTVGLHSISGIVAMAGTGESVREGEVLLLDPKDKTELRRAEIQGDGSFEFNFVPSGNYLVRVDARSGGRGGVPLIVYAPLEMPMDIESDVTNLTLNVPNAKAKTQ
ncbi:MAG TPA: carboxypeptidase regulatory-like domain-containing protein [Terracidiphilus sp.]|nr:carboxypeptidase regulatory-like domain-containing protein [Terracidiphilus sp.]